jgi:hypothetical protein
MTCGIARGLPKKRCPSNKHQSDGLVFKIFQVGTIPGRIGASPTLLKSWDIALETALIPLESTMLRVWIGLPEVILTQRAGAGTTGLSGCSRLSTVDSLSPSPQKVRLSTFVALFF